MGSMATTSKPLRADAARNRDRLLAAATAVFAERGLDAPLEHIARRAGVSIGTLYAHFPSREAFFAAIFPERLAALDRIGAAALAQPDPWTGFVQFLTDLFALQAEDRGLNDALAQRFPDGVDIGEACARGVVYAERIIERAQRGGVLRADFGMSDLSALTSAIGQIIRETIDTRPDAWRRFLELYVTGLSVQEA
ncbi:TetR family transcriptional regulator [Nocardia arthritidis]|uniref:TetR family transcriptional regulator n=2 Tax=Nocardia arthritidis TaxID=228602 RepID=A0A6G9YBR9_9NOCA|nr:TetR family transcriptional regulator [Nocardia arthritidis]